LNVTAPNFPTRKHHHLLVSIKLAASL